MRFPSHARLLAALCFLACAALAQAAEPAKFRADADGPFDPKQLRKAGAKPGAPPEGPDWYPLVEGQFPPENSAHAISGELMTMDPLERRFQIRVDRNDTQDRGIWDLPLDATMLPYGAIWYHGAPAALQDIPFGTHLHGLFYLKDPGDNTPPLPGPYNNRHTPETDFRRCFRLEDDFTFDAQRKQLWKVESVDFDTLKLTASLAGGNDPAAKPKVFDLLTGTNIFRGREFAGLKALEPGQTVLLNLTWVTLYGPGRITDLWIDGESRALATDRQLEKHRNHIHERGLPGWITAVNDETQVVTITFFGGVEEKLFEDLGLLNIARAGAPPLKEGEDPNLPKATLAVARDSLMTYDPVNDRKGGPVLATRRIPAEPGSSGVQIDVKCDMLLEGFRPRRIVRVYPGTWKVIALPREEQYFGRE